MRRRRRRFSGFAKRAGPAPALCVRSNLDAEKRAEQLPYRPRRALLSRGELAFYEVLRSSLRGRCGIGIKPRVADLLEVPRHQWRSRHGGRVAQRHVDFVLYDLETTAVLLVVELDDRSHERERVRERDAFLDAALRTAGVIVLHVRAARAYDPGELLMALERHFPPRTRQTGRLQHGRGVGGSFLNGGGSRDGR